MKIRSDVPGRWVCRKEIEDHIHAQEERQVVALGHRRVRHVGDGTDNERSGQAEHVDFEQSIVDYVPPFSGLPRKTEPGYEEKECHPDLLRIDGRDRIERRSRGNVAIDDQEHTDALHPINEGKVLGAHCFPPCRWLTQETAACERSAQGFLPSRRARVWHLPPPSRRRSPSPHRYQP